MTKESQCVLLNEYPTGKEGIYIDVFIARGEFAHSVLFRKRKIKVWDLELPLISPEDLILYKLISRRHRDLEDVRDILEAQKGKLDIRHMKKWGEIGGSGIS